MEQYETNHQEEGKEYGKQNNNEKEDLLNLYQQQFGNKYKQNLGNYGKGIDDIMGGMMMPIIVMYVPMMPMNGFNGYGKNMFGNNKLYGNRQGNLQDDLYNNSLADLLQYHPNKKQNDKPLLKELEDGNYIVNKNFIEELANKYETLNANGTNANTSKSEKEN